MAPNEPPKRITQLGDTKYVSRRWLPNRGLNHLVRGTRVRVRRIVEFHRKGYAIEDIQREYPELSIRQIQAALRFYRDHPAEFTRV